MIYKCFKHFETVFKLYSFQTDWKQNAYKTFFDKPLSIPNIFTLQAKVKHYPISESGSVYPLIPTVKYRDVDNSRKPNKILTFLADKHVWLTFSL